MDKGKAIACFLDHIEQLTRLPLITNQEMKTLYGDEIELALLELDRLNRENRICFNCSKNCCQQYGCEFYAPQLGWCPIFDVRPAICRLHFCEKFQSAAGTIIKELCDIFLDCLIAATENGSSKVPLFDIPPFANSAPLLARAVSPLVQAIKEDKLDPENGRQQILQEVMRYHQVSGDNTRSITPAIHHL